MPTITSAGSVDGHPAKVVYDPQRKQTQLFWGGRGVPDGPGHNHATIQDSSPDEFHFLRVNGGIVVNQSYDPKSTSKFQRDLQSRGGWGGMLADAFRKALRQYHR